MSDGPANLRPDAFSGTAADYARYRPPYPDVLIDHLLARVNQTGRLLDLACGPGRIALALADRFGEALAVDLEPEMIATGREIAAKRGKDNIVWCVGRAEDLVAPSNAFDLIAVGEAFHRLDQLQVLQSARRWLVPGGCFATVGSTGVLQGNERWQRAIADLARDWTRDAFPEGWATARQGGVSGQAAQEEFMRSAGFADVTSHDFLVEHTWTVKEIAGYLRSTSVCSKRILGERSTAFESALEQRLLELEPDGLYREQLRFGYTAGRRV